MCAHDILWRHPWPSGQLHKIAATDGTVCGLADGTIVAWDARTGAELWRQPTFPASRFGENLVVSDRTVYWTDAYAKLTARDLATGHLRWQLDQDRLRRFNSEPAIQGDTLYVVQSDLELADPPIGYKIFMAARSTDTGELRWTVPLDRLLDFNEILTPLASGDRAVYFSMWALFGDDDTNDSRRNGETYAVGPA